MGKRGHRKQEELCGRGATGERPGREGASRQAAAAWVGVLSPSRARAFRRPARRLLPQPRARPSGPGPARPGLPGLTAPTASCSSAPSRLSMVAARPGSVPGRRWRRWRRCGGGARRRRRPRRRGEGAGPCLVRPAPVRWVHPAPPARPRPPLALSGRRPSADVARPGRANWGGGCALEPGPAAVGRRGAAGSRGPVGGSRWQREGLVGQGVSSTRNEKVCGSCKSLDAPAPTPYLIQ